MEKTRILLAEDDLNLGFVLQESLEREGYEVIRCADGIEAHQAFLEGHFDLCLLDVMMPRRDGFTLAREIRKTDRDTPLIFLTAKSLKDDRIEGFKAGGDDYLAKPFSMEELLLRVQAVLRRTGRHPGGRPDKRTFEIGEYTFDYDRRSLTLSGGARMKGSTRKLTDKENDLLLLLCLHLNETLDREAALGRIWGKQGYFTSRSMDVYISKLRKYLSGDARIEIVNVRGRGFRLVLR
ncbi:MAG: response regulator transcription factor [Candidatus Krumholzibacteriota bacterium]|nr:response regulator transcription factor [Candidatus Krumholzibacteriota bacterium]